MVWPARSPRYALAAPRTAHMTSPRSRARQVNSFIFMPSGTKGWWRRVGFREASSEPRPHLFAQGFTVDGLAREVSLRGLHHDAHLLERGDAGFGECSRDGGFDFRFARGSGQVALDE